MDTIPRPRLDSLKGKSIAFTGKLASMTRAEAYAAVEAVGGHPVDGISKRTKVLVVGMDGWPLLADGQVSEKLQQTEDQQRQGRRVHVVSEERFLELIGKAGPRCPVNKSFGEHEVASLLGVPSATLKRWEQLGLIRSEDGKFDFQDLVSLRTIAGLIKDGVTPQTITRSMKQLASVLPGTERPLAQLNIVVAGSRQLLGEINGALMDPTGQLHMRFDGRAADEAEDSVPFAARPMLETTVPQYLDAGCEHEDAGELEEAETAFRRALEIEPCNAEAHFNLANVLRAAGRQEAAEERYRTATEHDPQLAVAWFNLADMLEEQDRLPDALAYLRTAVEVQPLYADAHFNLAACCDRAGLTEEACDHWRAYLQLDSSSEWAAVARNRLAG